MPGAIPQPEQFTPWLRRLPGFEGARVTGIAPVDGGASNITCRVEVEAAPLAALALRVQRERGIFEPYDVLREGRVIALLQRSPIPVPRLLACEPDASVLGAPFIVLEWVDAPHMGVAGAEADFGAYTAMVAAIHGLDWRGCGLAELGVPANAGAAVRGELEAVAARMPGFRCSDDPLLGRALARLRASVPGDGRLALCQGDINVFNYLFRARRVVAVVDWEQARISDPRSDIGQIVALIHLKGMPFVAPGELPFVRAYEAASGASVHGLEWFRAFWLFQLGVIAHGWRLFNGSEPWYTREQLETLLEAALAELD